MNRKVKITVFIGKEGDAFVIYSPALDLSSCGKTVPEAQRRFAQAVDAFFEELEEMGTLDEALASLGWIKTSGPKDGWNPHATDCDRTNVPTHLLRQKQLEIRVPVA